MNRAGFIVILMLALAVFSGTAMASGLDSFAPNPLLGGGTIRAFAVQPDGKVVLAGSFGLAGGANSPYIIRINANGTIDTTFQSPQFTYGLATSEIIIYDLVLQPDGKILVGGNFILVDNVPHPTLTRLNTDGTLDGTFAFNPAGSIGGSALDIDLQPDGKVLVAGAMYNAVNRGPLTRVNTDGSVDLSFNPGNTPTRAVLALPDGKVLASNPNNNNTTDGFIRRLNGDGSVDPDFIVLYTGGTVTRINALADGNYFIYGTFTNINNVAKGRAAKVSSTGALDNSFNAKGAGFDGLVVDANQGVDGKIIVCGGFSSYNGVSRPKLVRLNADGSLDETFTALPTTGDILHRAFPASGGKYIIAGFKAWPNPASTNAMGFASQRNNDGTADNSFSNIYTGGAGEIDAFGLLRDGRILTGGRTSLVANQPMALVARFSNGGVFDNSFLPLFGTVGSASMYQWPVEAFAEQPDGKVLTAGQGGVRRINPDGTFDGGFNTSFWSGSRSNDLLLLPDGKILVSGMINQRPIVRLNSDGSLDPGFDEVETGLTFGRSKMALQSDGKIILAGDFSSIGGVPRTRIARLNSDGSLDASFNPIGGANARIFSVAIQPNGKILIGGEFTTYNGVNKKYMARVNTDGSIDNSFTANLTAPSQGDFFSPPGVLSLKLLKTGKVLIGGRIATVDGQARNNIARLNSDGSLDTTFDVGGSGPNAVVRTLAVQPNGRILVGGDFDRFNGQIRIGVARLVGSAPLYDFDGDGKTDISIFRPSDSNWYLMQSQGGFAVQHFGLSTDRIGTADYDGDGRSDLAVYRDGAWWYLNSSNGALGLKNWGAAGDTPLPADFDGDGRSDFIYYHPSTGEWFRSSSATGTNSTVQWGIAGDIPVSGDFDGDGKADPTIFRPSSGTWWYLSSATGAGTPVQWGQSGDVPVAADFDGDGKTDIAVWRPSNGAWYVFNSSNGSVSIFGWGLAGDRPVPGDFDGDGRADIAVWRPSSGVWYIMQSTAGFTGMQFGLSTDQAVPSSLIQ